MAKQIIDAGILDGQVLGAPTFREPKPGMRVFSIPFSDGRSYETFEQDIANKIHPFIGQACSISYEHSKSPNGRFDNFHILDIGLPGSLGQTNGNGTAAAFFAPGPVLAAQQPVAQTAPAATIAPVASPQDKEQRIMRGNALNATGALLGPLVASGHFHAEDKIDTGKLLSAWFSLCEAAVGYLTTGQVPVVAPAVGQIAPAVGQPVAQSTADVGGVPF